MNARSRWTAAACAALAVAAAGDIEGPDGKPTNLTAEWVISARKGYAAARDLIGNEARLAELASLARTDNLKAADEALDMAAELILQQAELTERVRQTLLDFHRRLSHGE